MTSENLPARPETLERGFTRKQRIAWQVLAPAPLGVAVIFFLPMIVEVFLKPQARQFDGSQWGPFVVGSVFTVLAAYVMAGIPSLVFATLMEWAFAKGLAPHSWVAVSLAAALGAVAGAGMLTVPNGFVIPPGEIGVVVVFGAAGCGVGFVIGVVTKWRSSSGADGAQKKSPPGGRALGS